MQCEAWSRSSGVTADSREVPGRNACDKKHNNNNNKLEEGKEEEEEGDEELIGTVLRPICRSNKSDYWIFIALFV